MPNVKLFADEALVQRHGGSLKAILPELRALLCRDLAVSEPACQVALMTVVGLAGQPQINVEMQILPKDSRTPEALRANAERIRALISPAAGGAEVAVRVSTLDAETYVALK